MSLVGIENSLDQGNVDELAIGVIISQLVRSVEADYGSELIEFNGTTLDEHVSHCKKLDTKLFIPLKLR